MGSALLNALQRFAICLSLFVGYKSWCKDCPIAHLKLIFVFLVAENLFGKRKSIYSLLSCTPATG